MEVTLLSQEESVCSAEDLFELGTMLKLPDFNKFTAIQTWL